MAQLNDLLVMGQSTLLGPAIIHGVVNMDSTLTVAGVTTLNGILTQGSPSSDSSIISMNRFETDIFVSGNGSAPNAPTIAGFYLGKSSGDDNRHMDIVSGGDVAYIDFNKNTYGIDYSARLYVNVTTGATSWEWIANDDKITSKTFNVKGTLQQNSVDVVDLSSSQTLTNKTYNGYTLGSACAKGVTDSSSAGAISTGRNLVTERDVYYGLPFINGVHTYNSNTTIYAPTSTGTSGQILTSTGSGAPSWTNRLPITSSAVGGAYVFARDSALLKTTESDSSSKYMALISGKTQLGEFSYGAIHPYEQMEWIYTTDTGYNASDNTGLSADNTTGGYRRVLAVNSQGAVTAVSYNATSDKRLKTNLTPFISNHSILDLPLYRFDFIDGIKNQIGCMAQDLKEIYPELVTQDPNNGYLSINESKIVYLLIDEVKKLKKEIEKLKGKI